MHGPPISLKPLEHRRRGRYAQSRTAAPTRFPQQFPYQRDLARKYERGVIRQNVTEGRFSMIERRRASASNEVLNSHGTRDVGADPTRDCQPREVQWIGRAPQHIPLRSRHTFHTGGSSSRRSAVQSISRLSCDTLRREIRYHSSQYLPPRLELETNAPQSRSVSAMLRRLCSPAQ